MAVCSGGTLFADTIVLRDGSRREGTLRSCDEEHCSLDGKRIELSTISRIEFRNVSVPSSVRPNSLLQTDGTIVEGVFKGLSLGSIYVGDREIDRDVVAVIFIEAPPAPAPEPEPPSPVVQPGQPQPDTPPPAASAPPPPAPPAPVTPPSSPPRPPSTSSRSRSTPAERMWSGRIRGLAWGTVDSCRARLNVEVIVRLSEHVVPLLGPDGKIIGTATLLNPTGSTVRNRYRAVCPGGSASGRGTTTVTREDAKGGPGLIYRNTKNAPRRTANGIELQPGQAWYALTVAPDVNQEYDVTYRTALHTSSSPSGFLYPVIGGQPIVPLTPMSDPTPRYLQEGRMSGAYVTAAGGVYEKYALSWSICREGVRCPPVGSLPDDAQQQRCPEEAVAEVCGDQLMSYLEEWEGMQAEYADLMKLADSYYPDYTSALRRCAAWRIVQTILETILGAQTTKLGQAGENAANALKWFEALIEGDPTGPLGEALMSDAEEAFKPLEIANKVKGYLEEGNQIGELLSKSGDLNSLRGAAMDACLGAVNPEIHMRALKFIEHTRQAAEYYKNVFAPQRNDVEAKMRECEILESAAARACQ